MSEKRKLDDQILVEECIKYAFIFKKLFPWPFFIDRTKTLIGLIVIHKFSVRSDDRTEIELNRCHFAINLVWYISMIDIENF